MYDLRLEGDECVHGLAGEFVAGTDDGCLSDTGIEDESRLDLGGGQTMSGNVDDVYDNL